MGREAKERAWIVFLMNARRVRHRVDPPIIPRPYQQVAQGGYEHVARGGQQIRDIVD